MNVITQLFAIIAGLFHLAAFAMESLLFRRPQVQRLFLPRADASPEVVLFAFNQGFYNLFLAAGAIGGVIAADTGHAGGGRPVTLFACACMVGAGIVLVVSDRKLWRGALGQAVPPLVALLAALA